MKLIHPIGDYGYCINKNQIYKFITDKGIYLVEDGKVNKMHTFSNKPNNKNF